MGNKSDLTIHTGYTGGMMAYDAAKTYYQERKENQRHSEALLAQQNLQKMAYEHQSESEERERKFASQQAAEDRATQERVARMNLDMAYEAARNAEYIRQMELDAEQKMREATNQASIRVAELNLQAERQRGLETIQFEMAEKERLAEAQRKREEEAMDEKRRGGIVKDFDNKRIQGTYKGEYLREVPHGNGVFYYDDNRRYEGTFAVGKFDGVGKWFDFDGCLIYEGEWSSGRFNGNGCLKIDDGKFFVGEFKGGRMYKGVITDVPYRQIPSSVTSFVAPHLQDSFDHLGEYAYEGEMEGGAPNGKGKKTYLNGDTDDGVFHNGKAEGFIVRQRNGDVYMGNVIDNVENGYGVKTFNNGDTYDGEWKNGEINGQGKYIHNGIIYCGKWECTKDGMNLEGEALLQDGNVWKGSFLNFSLVDTAICHYPNGEVFEGKEENFKPVSGEIRVERDGVRAVIKIIDGQMQMPMTRYPDGTTFTGVWKNGEWKQGTLVLPDKTKYIGEFSNFNFNGYGIMEYATGDTYVGLWENGKWHGEGEFRTVSGRVVSGIWNSGVLTDD